MIFLETLKYNLKRLLHEKIVVLMTFFLPLIVILAISVIVGDSNKKPYIYIVNEDLGSIADEYIDEIKKDNNVKIYDKDIAVDKLKNKIINIVYEIPEDFTEDIKSGEIPQINSISIDDNSYDSSDVNFQYKSSNIVNSLILEHYMNSQGIDISYDELESSTNIQVEDNKNSDMTDKVLLNILISFIFFTCITVGTELYSLKDQNILMRSFVSGNSEKKILASVLTALFIIYSAGYSLVYFFQEIIRSSAVSSKLPYVVVNIICLSFVSICLGVFLVRICKKESTISIWGQGFSWITCFVGGSFMPYEFLPENIRMFSKFTPQYWAIESINNENLSLCLIVILFGIALFCAGTLKFKKLIMN